MLIKTSVKEDVKSLPVYMIFALLSRLYPWDHIPGVYIVRQAGGHDCHFDKIEYKFYENSKNLIVSNSMNLNYDILNLIKEK